MTIKLWQICVQVLATLLFPTHESIVPASCVAGRAVFIKTASFKMGGADNEGERK